MLLHFEVVAILFKLCYCQHLSLLDLNGSLGACYTFPLSLSPLTRTAMVSEADFEAWKKKVQDEFDKQKMEFDTEKEKQEKIINTMRTTAKEQEDGTGYWRTLIFRDGIGYSQDGRFFPEQAPFLLSPNVPGYCFHNHT